MNSIKSNFIAFVKKRKESIYKLIWRYSWILRVFSNLFPDDTWVNKGIKWIKKTTTIQQVFLNYTPCAGRLKLRVGYDLAQPLLTTPALKELISEHAGVQRLCFLGMDWFPFDGWRKMEVLMVQLQPIRRARPRTLHTGSSLQCTRVQGHSSGSVGVKILPNARHVTKYVQRSNM